MRAVIVCSAPGSSVTASALAFAVSTHSMPVHSSSPKSDIAADLATHGFQTTALAEPSRATVTVRLPSRMTRRRGALIRAVGLAGEADRVVLDVRAGILAGHRVQVARALQSLDPHLPYVAHREVTVQRLL